MVYKVLEYNAWRDGLTTEEYIKVNHLVECERCHHWTALRDTDLVEIVVDGVLEPARHCKIHRDDSLPRPAPPNRVDAGFVFDT